MFDRFLFSPRMPTPEEALPGRDTRPFRVAEHHAVLGNPLDGPYPAHLEVADFGLGCFWGAERLFWRTEGVWTTAVGYQGGLTPNPTYDEVCSGRTGHAEVVRVVFDPEVVSYAALLKLFWEAHDPTQGYRQGNDRGTQYRSVVFTHSPAQAAAAESSRASYAAALRKAYFEDVTTDVLPAPEFYFAEDQHQQYLEKNPAGYCALEGTDVPCPIPFPDTDA